MYILLKENGFLQTAMNNEINNVAPGDIHTSWANDLPSEDYIFLTGAGSVGVELSPKSLLQIYQ
jgi:hypothetical protein